MPPNISCLLALALFFGSALVAIPSQAQTAANSNRDITASSQSSVTDATTTSSLSNLSSSNKNKTTNISQSQPEDSSRTANTQKPERVRIPVYSRIGFGLSQ